MKTWLPRTGLSGFTVSLICAFFLCGSVGHAQQAAPVQPVLPPLQINFFVPVDVTNVNQLIQLMNGQKNIGRRDFILLISSQGGEVLSGLAAYNYLHGLGVNITTYNLGQVDSAANLLFCAGQHRFALPNSRFLIHSSFLTLPPGTPLNSAFLDGQLQQVKNMNQLSAQIIEATIGKKSKEIEAAIEEQNIFSPEEAVKLGLVEKVKTDFSTPGAAIAAIEPVRDPNNPPTPSSALSIVSQTPTSANKP